MTPLPHDRYYNPAEWRVYYGEVSLRRLSIGSGKTVSKIISHKGFDLKTNDNDVALLKLKTPLTFTSEYFPE